MSIRFAFILLTAALTCAAAGFLVFGTVLAVQPGQRGPRLEAKVDSAVLEALDTTGEANVIVSLAEPPSLRHRPFDVATLETDVRAAQSRVLSSIGAPHFALKIQYRAVPALAGHITHTGLTKLAASPHVARINLDLGGGGALATTVPLVDADRWHGLGVIGEGVTVAILDSGVDAGHVDLADDLIHEECFLDTNEVIDGVGGCPNGSDRQSGPGAAQTSHYHGTMTTGIVTSRGIVSPVGVAPGAEIVAIKVLDNNDSGRFYFLSEIVASFDYILTERPDVDILNMSLGTPILYPGDCHVGTAGAAAVNALRARGVTTFAASLNNGSGIGISWPACIPGVLSVGATDNFDNVASFTNSNATLDIMAPGVAVTTTGPGSSVLTGSGTSFASPHAAGCAALLLASGSATTPDDIEGRLKSSPVSVIDPKNRLAFPRIDCFEPSDVHCPMPTSQTERDSDADAVRDICDLCPNTTTGDRVDISGCSLSQVDSDGDGVCNDGAPSNGPAPGCVRNVAVGGIAGIIGSGDAAWHRESAHTSSLRSSLAYWAAGALVTVLAAGVGYRELHARHLGAHRSRP